MISKLFLCQTRNSSTFVSLQEALKIKNVGKKLKIRGWIKAARVQKQNTFIDLDNGLGIGGQKVQVIVSSDLVSEELIYHSALQVEGILQASTHSGQEVELLAENIKMINGIRNVEYPFKPRARYNDEHPRSYPHFRAKLNDFASLLRIRSGISHAIHDYFRAEEFIQIHTPILTSNDCEGAGEVFNVLPDKKINTDDPKESYFDNQVYLTVSGQLHLEAVCNGLEKVYTFSPAFRAERGKTKHHLSEFSMIEAEVAFMDNMEQLLCLQESLIKSSINTLMESHKLDLLNYLKLNSLKERSKLKQIKDDFGHIETVLSNPFCILTYDEAFEVIQKAKTKFKSKPNREVGLQREHELYLVEHYCNKVPVFIVEWPKAIKSFYARRSKVNPNFVQANDLLFPTVGELCGGSLREDNYDILKSNIPQPEKLQWYLDLRSSGAAPMGGFGLGFERLIQFLLKVNNIRDTLPFPRTPHSCKL